MVVKELKLKYLIIENFIPIEEKEKILGRARFDEVSRVAYPMLTVTIV